MNSLKDRIALVTGASRGIGAAVAESLAKAGAHVILVARQKEFLEQVDDRIQKSGGSATLVPFDLTEFPKIDELAAHIASRWGKLDILIGNAAILGELTPLTHLSPDLWQRVIDTNLTANWHLIRACDPLLRQSDQGRALFVTSGVARGVHPYWGAYAVSKAALEMLVATYAAELSGTTVQARIVDPGIARTAMRASAFPGEDPETLPEPVAAAQRFLKALA